MFTSEGEVRDEYVQESKAEPTSTDPAGAPVSDTGPADRSGSSTPEPESLPRPDQNAPPTLFMALADNLIVNAYSALGMVPTPTGARAPADHQAARQMIDLLEMLQEKTAGNLEDRESVYLDTHLGELKLAFVRQSQSL